MSKFKERVEQGCCGNCGHKIDRDGSVCLKCLRRLKDKYQAKRSKGLCTICGRRSAGAWCEGCTQVKKSVRQSRRLAGLCIICAEPAKGVYCNKHRTKRMLRFKARMEIGICRHCKQNKLPDSPLCLDCWLHVKARKLGLTNDQISYLWWSQHGRCVYSGRQLTPGVDAHLDHRMPTSKGGKSLPDNLQWVHSEVNHAKRALLEESFLHLVCDIATHQGWCHGKEADK